MKTKERVKKGELKVTEAMDYIDPTCKTYGWLERRWKRQLASRQEKKGK